MPDKITAFSLLVSLCFYAGVSHSAVSNFSQPESGVNNQLEAVLPELLSLFKLQQTAILEKGRPLSPREKKIARKIGIRQIDKVRILVARTLPKFEGPFLTPWAGKHQFSPKSSAAYTFGYGIIIKKGHHLMLFFIAAFLNNSRPSVFLSHRK